MSKRPWFKHYNNASMGDTIRQFYAEHDYESVAVFWYLLEYLSRNDDEQRSGKAVVKISFLSRDLNMKPSKVRRVLSRFSSVAQSWNCVCTDEELAFLVPNWSKMQENRGSKTKLKIVEKHGRGKRIEERSKKIDSESSNSAPQLSLELVIERYKEKYPPDFLTQQFELCKEYHWSKSGKEPTMRNLGYWLSNDFTKQAFEKYKADQAKKDSGLNTRFF